VIIEQDGLCQIAKEKGCDATLNIGSEPGVGGLTIRNPKDSTGVSVSSHFLERIAFEFLSLEWVITAAIEVASSDEAGLLTASVTAGGRREVAV
jgi:hypothetical protein